MMLQISIFGQAGVTPSYRDGVEGLVGSAAGDGGGPLDRHGQEVGYGQDQRHNWNITDECAEHVR